MRALIIDQAVMRRIEQATEKARAKTTPWSTLRKFAVDTPTTELTLADRVKTPGVETLVERSENVLIPHGYRAAISFEEQPAGIVRHLSVSVDTRGALPSIPAVQMIARAFGFDPIGAGTSRIWLEEFEPGHQAVNVIQVHTERQAGNA